MVSILFIFIMLFSYKPLIKSVCEGDWQFKDVPIEQNELDAKLKPELFCPSETYMYNCYYQGVVERAHNITKNRKWVSSSDKCQQFDAKGFLDIIRNRRVFYIGDSTMIQTWLSVICHLYQATKTVVDIKWELAKVSYVI